MLQKTLASFGELKIAKREVDAELATNKSLLAKEEAFHRAELAAIALLVSSEKRDKGFFRKLKDALAAMLATATKPENLVTIVSLLTLVNKLK